MKSLRDSVADIEPKYTKSVIQASLRTPKGQRTVWIVVEDIDDKKVYEKFFVPDAVKILISEDEKGRKGCANVESIVADIIAEENCNKILGIRDADYIKYESGRYVFPESIYVTDYRDIEMMMLSAPSVMAALSEWNADIPEQLEKGKPVARKFGYMRICNHVKGLNCIFKGNVKVHKVWDESTHDFYADWDARVMFLFLENCEVPFSKEEYQDVVAGLNLEDESYYDVCRGHDVIDLLQYMLINTQKYNRKHIMQKMIDSYALEDFKLTKLYKSVMEWTKDRNVNILS